MEKEKKKRVRPLPAGPQDEGHEMLLYAAEYAISLFKKNGDPLDMPAIRIMEKELCIQCDARASDWFPRSVKRRVLKAVLKAAVLFGADGIIDPAITYFLHFQLEQKDCFLLQMLEQYPGWEIQRSDSSFMIVNSKMRHDFAENGPPQGWVAMSIEEFGKAIGAETDVNHVAAVDLTRVLH